MKYYIIIFSCLLSLNSNAVDTVKVGLYDFPPYAMISDKSTSITMQLLAAMNKFQTKYEFVAVPTTSKRRYRDFEKHRFDMIIFEDKKWGWQTYPVVASAPFATGFEVYVSRVKLGRGQDFFTDFHNKVMIGVLGYHYQFANFQTDPEYLQNNFNLIQTDSQTKSLELILNGRGDIAVLSKEFLNYHFKHFPEDEGQLLISETYDQIYRHTILLRDNGTLSVDYINALIEQMKNQGGLTSLLEEYGLVVE